jgi:hypothetical protein
MVAEALVLGGDEGLLDAGGDGLDGDEDAALGGELGHQARVGGVDAAHLLGLVVGQPAVVGQLGRDGAVQAEDRDAAADQATTSSSAMTRRNPPNSARAALWPRLGAGLGLGGVSELPAWRASITYLPGERGGWGKVGR